jgi:DNA-binding NtrC family response regulator
MTNDKLIGRSEAMNSVRALIKQVAHSDISVLITGESGVGKEVVAEAIHNLSRRAGRPLITVNCGAIPEGIFESEVFGHEKGSFTGADKQRKGYFELADGGTIFLDEIGEMPLNAQVKILRILETGEFMRVGGGVNINIDVRVVAATNRDLAGAVSRGEFRSDLYYRLKAVNIYIPPLSERKEDIPPLTEHFVAEFCKRNQIPLPKITDSAMDILINHEWEGNVRELKNFIESLVTLERGRVFDKETVQRLLSPRMQMETQLPMRMTRSPEQMERELIYRTLMDMRRELWEMRSMMADYIRYNPRMEVQSISLEELEQEQIRKALKEYHSNRRQVADALGLSERTLYRKLKKYGL